MVKSDKENELNRWQAIARLPLICYSIWSPHLQMVILDLVGMGDHLQRGTPLTVGSEVLYLVMMDLALGIGRN